jgi:bifunctional pyridoxal-dependent enzyme with beta-cystathionase and maltose regulon repressor activities
MNGWEPIVKLLTDSQSSGYAKGYEQGSAEMKQYLAQQIIYSINQDAVLRMTADVDTLERVVEIIEAVRDIGKAQS